ncbi:MAG: hypothetical protein Q8Q39_01835 [bacterium]|nr:hypothetical protein [bacterium]
MILENILEAFRAILLAFFTDLNIWWFLAPIMLLWILTEIYDGEYRHELPSRNAALGNGISLTWINIASLRILFTQNPDDLVFRFLILFAFSTYGLAIIYFAFTHRISARKMGILAAPTPLYTLSVFSVLYGQMRLPLDRWILTDLLIIFLIFQLFWLVMHRFVIKGRLGDLELVEKGVSLRELKKIEDKLDGE